MFVVIFQGVESGTHRDTLESVRDLFDDPPHLSVGISYKSLRSRRLGEAYIHSTLEKGFSVILEAGVSTTAMTADQAAEMAREYYEFVHDLPMQVVAVEFEHPSMNGTTSDPNERILPLWRGDDPMALREILREQGSVAMAYESDPRVPAILRSDSHEHSVLLALGQPDLAEAKKAGFNMAMTQAWVAPSKYGELSVWDGSKFHRSSSADKPRLLAKYGHVIERYGLDLDLIKAQDARELNRLAAFSFIKWAESLDTSDKSETSTDAEVVPLRAISGKKVDKRVTKTRSTQALPIFDQEEVEGLEEDQDGRASMRTRSVLRASSETVRVCDSCFLASTCPAYEAGSSCAFNFPVEVRTDTQVKALLSAMLELQASRVAFARFAEEVNGGNPDPVVGQEMDRLFRMAEKAKKVEERREHLSVTVDSRSSGGGTGMLSAIFGERAAALNPPENADTVIAEVIEDD